MQALWTAYSGIVSSSQLSGGPVLQQWLKFQRVLLVVAAVIVVVPKETTRGEPQHSASDTTTLSAHLTANGLESKSADSTLAKRVSALESRFDGLRQVATRASDSTNDPLRQTAELLDLAGQKTYNMTTIALVIVGVLVTIFGVVVPIVQHRYTTNELDRMLKSQTERFQSEIERASKVLQEVSEQQLGRWRNHSERLSMALAAYTLGELNLSKSNNVYYYLPAFSHFVACLDYLVQLEASQHLPNLYEACLHGIAECRSRRWGSLSQIEVDRLRLHLNALRTHFANIHVFAPSIKIVEEWLARPGNEGEPVILTPHG